MIKYFKNENFLYFFKNIFDYILKIIKNNK